MTDGAPTRRVPVVLDAHSLSSQAAGGGIATYLQNLMAALAARPDIELTALCSKATPLPSGVARATIQRFSTHPRILHVEHLMRLPLDLRWARGAGSVFHNPVFHAPAGVQPPWVQTLHDVIPLVHYSPDMAVLTKRWKRFGPRYLKASAIIADSQHSASEGIRVLGLNPDRVHVAHLGVSPEFVPGTEGPSDPPYILMVNEFSRRKAYGEAFAVFDALVDAGYPHRLVVVGRVHDWNRDEFNQLLGAAHHRDRIDIREWVPDLVPIYQSASAFLMTSHYEGFGLTPLEAMACGVPVVAYANSSVTEIIEGGGQLVPDGDVVAMIAAVRQVLDEPELALEWRQRGPERARTFTWTASAAIHAEVYRSVAE
jgi:glycosyltransferase involved in cell wall biosynthesis